MRERAFLEAVFPIDGIPHLFCAVPGVSCKALRVLEQANIVSLGGCALILRHTVIPLVTFIVVFYHAALADIVAKAAL
jgi:hypothetical protein